MNNPFDLASYQPQICMKDVQRAHKSSFQQSSVVNRRRQAGVEPSLPLSANSRGDLPQTVAIPMPTMKKYSQKGKQ